MKQKYMKTEIILTLVIFVLLAGCGKKSAEEQTVIRFFNPAGFQEEIKMAKEIIGKFEKDNPDIKVRYEYGGGNPDKLLVEMAGGSAPDVFFRWERMEPLAEKNSLLELDGYIEKYDLDLNDYFAFADDLSKYKGKVYWLPVAIHLSVMYYNKDIFDKTDTPYPDGSWTWDDYYKIARELTCDLDEDGRRDQFGTQLNWWCYAGYLPPGQGVIDIREKRVNLRDKGVQESLRFLCKLYKDTCPTLSEMDTFGGVGGVSPFETGKIAMFPQTVAYVNIFSKIKNFRWDIVPLPIPFPRERTHSTSAEYLAIPRQSKHPEEAFRFLKYYCGKEGMKTLVSHKRFILPYKKPAYKSFVPPPENIRCLEDIVKENYALPALYGCGDMRWDEVMETFNKWWQLILIGEIDFDEGIDKCEEEMNRRIEQLFGSN